MAPVLIHRRYAEALTRASSSGRLRSADSTRSSSTTFSFWSQLAALRSPWTRASAAPSRPAVSHLPERSRLCLFSVMNCTCAPAHCSCSGRSLSMLPRLDSAGARSGSASPCCSGGRSAPSASTGCSGAGPLPPAAVSEAPSADASVSSVSFHAILTVRLEAPSGTLRRRLLPSSQETPPPPAFTHLNSTSCPGSRATSAVHTWPSLHCISAALSGLQSPSWRQLPTILWPSPNSTSFGIWNCTLTAEANTFVPRKFFAANICLAEVT
mmetsp:Transcript_17622/g.42268  ORF Transcript_17622/g.42268 Transcript_17622/m.42268 type:complete len:268 (-) Transcript_17622:306-1109(-)